MIVKPAGYDEATAAGEFQPLPPGGYVCRISKAELGETQSGKPKLVIEVDIEEGAYKGYFRKQFDNDTRQNKKWGAKIDQLIDNPSSLPFFKGLITAIENSNAGYKFFNGNAADEKSLVGKLVGCVFGREQYVKQDGSGTAFATKIFQVRSIEVIRKGVEPPVDKLLDEKALQVYGVQQHQYAVVAQTLDDEDLPF